MRKVRFITLIPVVVTVLSFSILNSCSKQDVAGKDVTGK